MSFEKPTVKLPPVSDMVKKDTFTKQFLDEMRSDKKFNDAPVAAAEEPKEEPPKDRPKGNFITNNMFGLLAAGGGLLALLMTGSNILIAGLGALALGAIGGSFDSSKGLLGLTGLFGKPESDDKGKDKGETQLAAAGPGQAAAVETPHYFRDKRVSQDEFKNIRENQRESSAILSDVAERLGNDPHMGANPIGYRILTPEAKGGDLGPVIYAQVKDSTGNYQDIQVALPDGRVVKLEGKFDSKDPNIADKIVKEAMRTEATSPESAQVDEIKKLLETQFKPSNTPATSPGGTDSAPKLP